MEILKTLIICGLSVMLGILAGNSAVFVFNKIPPKWLCDYGQEPGEELLQTDRQRIKSIPWKAAFSMIFSLATIKMSMMDWQYALAGLVALWLLLEIAIADWKYKIIPDQFTILLSITAFGFVPFHHSIFSPFWGALTGGGCMMFIALLGKLIFKRDALGFGDVKLFAAIGLITGPYGAILIFAGSSFLSGTACAYLLLRRKRKPMDTLPLAPYIALACAMYILLGDVAGFL